MGALPDCQAVKFDSVHSMLVVILHSVSLSCNDYKRCRKRPIKRTAVGQIGTCQAAVQL